MTNEVFVSRPPGEKVEVGIAELTSVSGWVTQEAVFSSRSTETARVGKIESVFVLELVTDEVTIPDGVAVLVCAPMWVTIEFVVCGSEGERVRVA